MAERRIAIVGDGQMGLVLANLLAQRGGAEVVLWGHDHDDIARLAQLRVSPRLPGLPLPDAVRVTADGARAMAGAELVVSAVPTQYIRPVWGRLAAHLPPSSAIVSVAKGIENETLLRPTQVVADALGGRAGASPPPMAVLSGPTIAAELARCLPATMIVASDDPALAETVQSAFSASWLRIYTGSDPTGVELAGATKNVIAIAAGILDGLHAGFNAKSALLARGLAEITRLGVAMGADSATFFGLAGAGDLATTCFSPEGRNRSCGEALGSGRTLAAFLEGSASIVEGVDTTKSVKALAERHGVEMPITAAVHAVLYDGLDPIDGIGVLMNREPKAERVG